MRFQDRTHAGRILAEALSHETFRGPLVVALPRGGVPVAAEVARYLQAPLEALVVRKIGDPANPERAIGAMIEGGQTWLDDGAIRAAGRRPDELAPILRLESIELVRRIRDYRGGRSFPALFGRDVILVDDGIATGASAALSIRWLRDHDAGQITLAAPVGSPRAVEHLETLADSVLCLKTPPDFEAVSEGYEDFTQTSDDEVIRLLDELRSDGREDSGGFPFAPLKKTLA